MLSLDAIKLKADEVITKGSVDNRIEISHQIML